MELAIKVELNAIYAGTEYNTHTSFNYFDLDDCARPDPEFRNSIMIG